MAQKSVLTERYSTFLAEIIAARRDAGLTQLQLAKKLHRPQSYVSKYERGERRLDVLEFVHIAVAIGVEPCSLLNGLRAKGGGK